MFMASLMVHHTQKQADLIGWALCHPPQTGPQCRRRRHDSTVRAKLRFVCQLVSRMLDAAPPLWWLTAALLTPGWGGGSSGVLHTHVLSNNPPRSTANLWIWQPGACIASLSQSDRDKNTIKKTKQPTIRNKGQPNTDPWHNSRSCACHSV